MADDYLREFVHESEEQITTLNNALLDLEQDPSDETAMERIFRTAHTLKSNCGAMGFDRASDLAHAIEDLLEEVRAGRVEATTDLMDTVFAGVDELEAMLEDVQSHGESRRSPEDIISQLREYVPDEDGIAPPSGTELDTFLESAEPSRSGYNLYHVRLSVPGDETVDGPAVIDALDDAFELFRTEPSEEAAASGPYGGTIDALFGSVVDEDAVREALAPVEAVDEAIVTEVTDRYQESTFDDESDATEQTPDAGTVSDPDDVDVDELLDSVDHFDDIDEMAEQIEDTSGFDDMGEAGTFDDLDVNIDDELGIDEPDESDTGATEAAAEEDGAEPDDEPEDANETFQELKQEVDPVSFDELQEELDDLEFDEYADEEEVGFDELLGEDELESDDGMFGPTEAFDEEAQSEDDPFGAATDEEGVDDLLEETIDSEDAPSDAFADDSEAAGFGEDNAQADSIDEEPFVSGDEDGLFDDIAEEVSDSAHADDAKAEAASGDTTADEPEMAAREGEAESEASAADSVDESEPGPAVEGSEVESEQELTGDERKATDVETAPEDHDIDEEPEPGVQTGDSPDIDEDAAFGEIQEPPVETSTWERTEIEFGDDVDVDGATAKTFDEGTTSVEDDSIEVGNGIEDDSFGDIDPSTADAGTNTASDDVEGFGGEDDSASPSTSAEDDVQVSTFDQERPPGTGGTSPTDDAGFGGSDGSERTAPADPGFDTTGGETTTPEDPGFGDTEEETTDDDREIELTDLGVPSRLLEESRDSGPEMQSIRVDVDRMDDMLNLIEGLVTSRARLRRALDEGEPRSVLDDELGDLEEVTSELQDTVMDVRLVPLSTVVNKLPRTVRDIARERDKQVELETIGTDVEIDRSVLNEINDPLVHLVRNAVDHGIESPDEREDAGKPPTGTVTLSAERRRDRVIIEVQDDGRGLDAEGIRAEAIEEDVVSESEADEMSDDEVYDLVFHSGLSTSEEVTDVSGRGVGMDVVANTVESLDGSVDIESSPGQGTTVRLELPVTLAIAEVLFVQVGAEEYGIPIRYVDQIGPEVAVETQDGHEVLVSDGGKADSEATDGDEADDEPRRLIRLDETLDTPGESAANGMLVHIREDVRPIALRCDRVRGQQEVVIKPFEGVLEDIPGLSGASVLGDGDVVNILDVETI